MTDQTPAQTLLEATCDRERVAIIFNPASGGGDSKIRRSGLEELARSAGLSCELQETDADHGAGPLAAQAVADCGPPWGWWVERRNQPGHDDAAIVPTDAKLVVCKGENTFIWRWPGLCSA